MNFKMKMKIKKFLKSDEAGTILLLIICGIILFCGLLLKNSDIGGF
jgi:hypothetical protein